MKLCVYLPSWIGDVAMATPAFRLLHEQLNRADNHSEMTALAPPNVIELLDGVPWFSNYIPIAKRPFSSLRETITKIKEQQFDAIILFPNSLRSAFLAWYSGIKSRFGYSGDLLRRVFLTNILTKPPKPTSVVDYYLNLAAKFIEKKLGCDVDISSPVLRKLELFTTPFEEELGEHIWKTLGLQRDHVVFLNIGSANRPIKRWNIDNAAKCARDIVSNLGYDVLINCAPGEFETIKHLVEKAETDRVFYDENLTKSIHAVKSCIKKSVLTISTDSGPLHIASAFGKETIVLLGPTKKWYIANPTINQSLVSVKVPCSPCKAKQYCPKQHHDCMNKLSSDMVIEAVTKIIDSKNTQ